MILIYWSVIGLLLYCNAISVAFIELEEVERPSY
jgi:hypothetical protein